MLQLFEDLGITDRLQWKKHAMLFARADRPGVLSRFDFPDIPGPFNGLYAIFKNTDMLSLQDKLLFGLSLVPAILFGQKYVEEMDSVRPPRTPPPSLTTCGMGKVPPTSLRLAPYPPHPSTHPPTYPPTH
jgi:hypothetical protein